MPILENKLASHECSWQNEIKRLTSQRLSMLGIHVTDHCNSNCKFCVVNSPIRQREIKTEDLVEFVLAFANKKIDILNLHGGEPTVSEALLPIIDAAHSIGINEIHLQTNGIKLADEELVARLIDKGVKVFVISLHGNTAELQESISLTPNSFSKILHGIENCLRAGALVRTNTVICRQNINYLYDILMLSHRLGVPWQNISALHPTERALAQFPDVLLHPKEIRDLLPPILTQLLAEAPDITLDLEGFATCHVPGFEDHHLKKELRDIKLKYHEVLLDNYEEFMDSSERKLIKDCASCCHIERCNGIYKAYQLEFQGQLVWPKTKEMNLLNSQLT